MENREIIINISLLVIMHVRWSMTWAVEEFTERRKCRVYRFYFTFPPRGKGWVCRYAPAPDMRGRGCEFSLVTGWLLSRMCSVGLQLVLMLSLGAGRVVRWSGRSCFQSSWSLCAFRVLPVIF